MNRWLSRTAVTGTVLLVSAIVGTAAGSTRPTISSGHPVFGTVAVADQTNSVLTFAPAASGNTAPVTDIAGAATGLADPVGVGYDRHGNLYVSNVDSASITVYAPNATGNAAPIVTIAGANTTLADPIGLAVTPAGDIWVANDGGPDILEFAAGSVGDAAPIRTIRGAATGLTSPYALALTPDGTGVWVTDTNSPQTAVEREFSTHANGDVPPISTISGGRTQIDLPYGVAAAVDGSVVFGDESTPPAVLTFGPHDRGNAVPRHVITGSSTGLADPELIGLNPVGEIWVPNFPANSVTRYSRTASGNAAPDRRLAGAATLLNRPNGVAVYMQPPSAPRSLKKHVHGKRLTLRWHRPRVNGGGIQSYIVRHAKHKSGRFHIVKITTKRRYTRHHAAHGYYDVLAFNQAGFGKHSKRGHFA
jgi:hypothetical protein